MHEDTRQSSLETCAKGANREHREVISSIRNVVLHAKAAGEWLVKAKEKYCYHGAWTKWLKENFEASPETARAYMRVAKNWRRLIRGQVESKRLTLAEALRSLRVKKSKDPQTLASNVNDLPRVRGFGWGSASSAIACDVPANDTTATPEITAKEARAMLRTELQEAIRQWSDDEVIFLASDRRFGEFLDQLSDQIHPLAFIVSNKRNKRRLLETLEERWGQIVTPYQKQQTLKLLQSVDGFTPMEYRLHIAPLMRDEVERPEDWLCEEDFIVSKQSSKVLA